ncbi:hypothetical protein KEM60_01728 [Austwickia sp. TVS 96-490-7B]|uniref:S1C family serine protease n=1 Tax=Austwickia sp. TVS 96-490-7B TaxID=2830843 RepID=UPI001D5C9116|nr:trypsin-like peptidase domain-containing protein [Austwickia sp. TVS 96-490-7B]MBW3085528.1 hypothetical protein [Austwickia sp. TVS 96-490-7B]
MSNPDVPKTEHPAPSGPPMPPSGPPQQAAAPGGPYPQHPQNPQESPAGQPPPRPADPHTGESTTWAQGDNPTTRPLFPPPPADGRFGPPTQQTPGGPPIFPPPGNPSPGMPGSSGPWPMTPPGQAFGSPTPVGPAPERPGRRRRTMLIGVGVVVVAALACTGLFAAAQLSTSEETPETVVRQSDMAHPDWSATAKAVGSSVVSIRATNATQGGDGSGVIIDKKGHIVTNNHVVAAGAEGGKITVVLDDKRVYDATIVGTDPDTDLAVLTLNNAPDNLRPIALGDDTKLHVGDPVMAVGNPLGLSGTVTTGIVSALNRPVRTRNQAPGATPNANPVVTNAIQTSAAINPGNSGGALVDGQGRLIGINSSIATMGAQPGQQGGNIGIGFAIPVNEVKNVSGQLIATGKAKHALLGVTVDDTVADDGKDKRAAAKIASTSPGSAADKAGLKVGDPVIAVDNEPVDSGLALSAQIRERQVGDTVTLTVVRDGKRQDIKVTLEERNS